MDERITLKAGVDIIEIERVRGALQRFPQRFLTKVFTEEEAKRYTGQVAELAARFAGKEAVSKVLGTGFLGVSPREIEILSEPSGKPLVRLHGRAARHAARIHLQQIDISLSHNRRDAVAFAVGYCSPPAG